MMKMRNVQIRVNFEGTDSDYEKVGRELFDIIKAEYEEPSFCGYTMIWDTVVSGAGMDRRLKALVSALQSITECGVAVGAGYSFSNIKYVPNAMAC